MADSVFHKDFKAMPWWWEWWHPHNELSQDPPLKTDVLVVGAGYGGLSTALELGRSGIDVTVLERGDFGVETPRLAIVVALHRIQRQPADDRFAAVRASHGAAGANDAGRRQSLDAEVHDVVDACGRANPRFRDSRGGAAADHDLPAERADAA